MQKNDFFYFVKIMVNLINVDEMLRQLFVNKFFCIRTIMEIGPSIYP